jgi:hypothetical protein
VAEDEQDGEDTEVFVLIEGRLLGFLLFPYAMAEMERVPPANDTDPGAAPSGPQEEGPQAG